MTKEEVISMINDSIEDNEKAVKILEAFDDYTKENDTITLQGEITRLEGERDDVLRRYRERFAEGETVTEETGGSEVEPETEEEIIDVDEIEYVEEG